MFISCRAGQHVCFEKRNMAVTVLKNKAEFDEFVTGNNLVLVDFFAEWCGPCKMIAPHIEAMSKDDNYSYVKFAKVDVDEAEDVSEEQGISAMPTFRIFKGGKKVDELVGANLDKIKELLAKHK